MIYQSNKHFNAYKEGQDLEVQWQYCMEHGEVRTFLRGETLEESRVRETIERFVEGTKSRRTHTARSASSAARSLRQRPGNGEDGREDATGKPLPLHRSIRFHCCSVV